MGNVQTSSLIDETNGIHHNNGTNKGAENGATASTSNGSNGSKSTNGVTSSVGHDHHIEYRNRGCRSCFSVHDPRRPVEKLLESDIERMKVAAKQLFVKGDRTLDRLTQDDIDRIIEDEPHRLRDLPDLRGKGAAEIMRYFNKYGQFASSESLSSHSGHGSSYWITPIEVDACIIAWATHRASLSAGVTALRNRLGIAAQVDADAISAEIATGFMDDLLPELYGMEAKMIGEQFRLTGKRNITADMLLEQIIRIAITERMTFSWSGYHNVLQRQALSLFNRYDIGQRSCVPKSIVLTWIQRHQLNLSRDHQHASQCHQMSNVARVAMAHQWLGQIGDVHDVWTRTELMTLLYDIGPQTRPSDAHRSNGDLVVPPSFVKNVTTTLPWPEYGVWTIIIHEAKGLPKKLGVEADGYVTVYGQQSADGAHLQKAWTHVVDNSANPQFGAWKYERIAAADEVIVLEVWDQDVVTSDDFIGQCVIMLHDYQSVTQWSGGITITRDSQPLMKWMDIMPRANTGQQVHKGAQLRVEISFKPLVPALGLLPNWPRYQFKSAPPLSSLSSMRQFHVGVSSLLPSEVKRTSDTTIPSYQRASSSSTTALIAITPGVSSTVSSSSSNSNGVMSNDSVAAMLNGSYTTPTSLSFVPSCIVVDHDQSLLVCDRVRSRIVRLSTTGDMKTLVSSSDGLAAPVSLAIYDATRYIIVDAKHRALFMMAPLESFGSRVGTAMSVTPFGPRGLFQSPSSVVVTSIGNIIVSDAATNLIHMISPNGMASLYAGSGYMASNDGIGRMASIACPLSLAIDRYDNIYVAQAATGLAAIRMITPEGHVTTIAGSTTIEPNQPLHRDGIACIKNELGDLVVAAHITSSIKQLTTPLDEQKAASARSFTSSIMDQRHAASSARGHVARFGTCSGIAVDGDGSIYVADCDTRTIRYINRTANQVITIAGPPHGDDEPNYVDDATNAENARFRSPVALAVSSRTAAASLVYVADAGNGCIRRVTLHDQPRAHASIS